MFITDLTARLRAITKKNYNTLQNRNEGKIMNFSFKQIESRFRNFKDYKWYSDDLYEYLRKLGTNAPFIAEHFAKLWYWGRISDTQAKKINLRNRLENYDHWAKEIIERIDFCEYDYDTGEGLQAGERPILTVYEPNTVSVESKILYECLKLCMYSKEDFESWVLERNSQEKGYPPINPKKLPLVRKSYLAFIYWIFKKLKSKKDFNDKIAEYKIIKFAQEISKLKIDSDYTKKVNEIRFCENTVDEWNSIIINFNSTQEIAPRDFAFLEIFKDKIKLCEEWQYYPKMDSLMNFVNL